jgi:putative component of membrane protein insertase Oxa1/YidC/SpoIIIJ protein YidD
MYRVARRKIKHFTEMTAYIFKKFLSPHLLKVEGFVPSCSYGVASHDAT